jgi:drug/metabolite transporter (DMT)-like permease
MRTLAVVAAALGSMMFFALATALKHRSAGQTPDARARGTRALLHFLGATVRHPLWLAGLAADAGGVTLQVTALHIGALAAVQPLLVTSIVVSLLLNHRLAGTRVEVREIRAAAVLVAAIAGFLVVSGASSPAVTGPVQPADVAPAVSIGVAAVLLAIVCVVVSRRLPHGQGAALLGITVGVTFACTAALIKACSNIVLAHGPVALLTSWQPYVLVAAGAAGLALTQLAFQAGPLRLSLPATASVDPLLSIALGVLIYDEHLRTGPLAIAGELGCLAVMCAAAAYLSLLTPQASAPPAPPAAAAV